MNTVELGHASKNSAFAPNGATAFIMPLGAESWVKPIPPGGFFLQRLLGGCHD